MRSFRKSPRAFSPNRLFGEYAKLREQAINLFWLDGACGSIFLSSFALTGVIVKFTAVRLRLVKEDSTSLSLAAKSDFVTMKTGYDNSSHASSIFRVIWYFLSIV